MEDTLLCQMALDLKKDLNSIDYQIESCRGGMINVVCRFNPEASINLNHVGEFTKAVRHACPEGSTTLYIIAPSIYIEVDCKFYVPIHLTVTGDCDFTLSYPLETIEINLRMWRANFICRAPLTGSKLILQANEVHNHHRIEFGDIRIKADKITNETFESAHPASVRALVRGPSDTDKPSLNIIVTHLTNGRLSEIGSTGNLYIGADEADFPFETLKAEDTGCSRKTGTEDGDDSEESEDGDDSEESEDDDDREESEDGDDSEESEDDDDCEESEDDDDREESEKVDTQSCHPAAHRGKTYLRNEGQIWSSKKAAVTLHTIEQAIVELEELQLSESHCGDRWRLVEVQSNARGELITDDFLIDPDEKGKIGRTLYSFPHTGDKLHDPSDLDFEKRSGCTWIKQKEGSDREWHSAHTVHTYTAEVPNFKTREAVAWKKKQFDQYSEAIPSILSGEILATHVHEYSPFGHFFSPYQVSHGRHAIRDKVKCGEVLLPLRIREEKREFPECPFDPRLKISSTMTAGSVTGGTGESAESDVVPLNEVLVPENDISPSVSVSSHTYEKGYRIRLDQIADPPSKIQRSLAKEMRMVSSLLKAFQVKFSWTSNKKEEDENNDEVLLENAYRELLRQTHDSVIKLVVPNNGIANTLRQLTAAQRHLFCSRFQESVLEAERYPILRFDPKIFLFPAVKRLSLLVRELDDRCGQPLWTSALPWMRAFRAELRVSGDLPKETILELWKINQMRRTFYRKHQARLFRPLRAGREYVENFSEDIRLTESIYCRCCGIRFKSGGKGHFELPSRINISVVSDVTIEAGSASLASGSAIRASLGNVTIKAGSASLASGSAIGAPKGAVEISVENDSALHCDLSFGKALIVNSLGGKTRDFSTLRPNK